MSTSRSAVIPICTLLLAGCASTQKPVLRVETAEWREGGLQGRRIVTDHFEIYSTLRDSAFEEGLPGYAEAVYAHFERTLPAPGAGGPPIVLYVFGHRSEWEAFTEHRFPRRYPLYRRIHSGGYTEGGISALFHVERGGTLATIAHEGWHQYVASRFPGSIPAWINEGLACYHESVDCAGPEPRFTPKRNTLRSNTLREALQRGELLSLEEIVRTDAGRVLSGRGTRVAQIYYAQVWALVTYLQHDAPEKHREAFGQMLHDIADGSFGRRCSAARLLSAESTATGLGEIAFRAYFETAPTEMSDDYRAHLAHLAGF